MTLHLASLNSSSQVLLYSLISLSHFLLLEYSRHFKLHISYIKLHLAKDTALMNTIHSLGNKPGNINTFSTSVLKRIRRHVSHVLCHIINLSLRKGIFLDCLKLPQWLPYQKAVIQLMLATIDQYRCSRSLVKYWKKLYINSYTHILSKIIYFMSINTVSGNISLLCKHYWITCNLCMIA